MHLSTGISGAVFASTLVLTALPLAPSAGSAVYQPPKLKSRTFLFTYTVRVANLPKDKTVKLWLPVPQASLDQDVILLDAKFTPGDKGGAIGTDPVYGNQMLCFQATPTQENAAITASHTFKVTRREVCRDKGPKHPDEKKGNLQRFLQPDRLVPLEGKPLDLIKGEKLGASKLELAKSFYAIVNRHMKYSKEGVGWGNGDAVWACDSKFGNCSDFHSLFISLARSHKIPAKFEMGFPIPSKHGEGAIAGYHCWAWFLLEEVGWVTVDISEANRFPELRDYYFGNLSEDRVAFTVGRDIDLAPKQSGPPLNFFIYPYAETDGQPLAAERIESSFTFKDSE
jgi:transglutaminase-like putative cysteine protease